MKHDEPSLPFSHVVNVRTLPRRGRSERYEPDDAAREAISRHCGVDAIEDAAFEAEVAPWKRDGISVKGRVQARVRQACVVSLEPVGSRVDESFAVLLVPEGSALASPRRGGDAELFLDAEGDDPPDTFTGDTIDLATVWLEHLTLAIDPFPRAPDATLPEAAGEKPPSPFAALAGLKPANDR